MLKAIPRINLLSCHFQEQVLALPKALPEGGVWLCRQRWLYHFEVVQEPPSE